MSSKGTTSILLLAMSLFLLYSCKGNGNTVGTQERTDSPRTLMSPTKLAQEFIKSGISGDFQKLSVLCCQEYGPYTSLQAVRNLDLSDLGFIKEVVREE